MAIETRELKYFCVVAATKSLTRAAAVLHVSQPAISLQIQKLEDKLGCKLLERQSRGVTLTTDGERFFIHAEDILSRISTAYHDMQTGNLKPKGIVTVGMPQSIAKLMTEPLINTILSQWPDIDLRIVELSTGYIPKFIEENQINLGITFSEPKSRNIKNCCIAYEELFLISPAHDIKEKGIKPIVLSKNGLSLREISALPLVLPMQIHSIRELLDNYAHSFGLKLNVVADINSIPQLIDLVISQVGYTILTSPSVQQLVQTGELYAHKIHSPAINRPVYLCRSAINAPLPSVKTVEKLIIHTAKSLVSEKKWPAMVAQ